MSKSSSDAVAEKLKARTKRTVKIHPIDGIGDVRFRCLNGGELVALPQVEDATFDGRKIGLVGDRLIHAPLPANPNAVLA